MNSASTQQFIIKPSTSCPVQLENYNISAQNPIFKPRQPKILSKMSQLRVIQAINTSRFEVYAVEDTNSNFKYAIKLFPTCNNSSRLHPSYVKESMFKDLQHPNVVRIREVADRKMSMRNGQKATNSLILMDLAINGDVSDFLMNPNYRSNEILVRTMFRQMCEGVRFLHSNRMAHMDLKCENLLIDHEYTIKVCDFDQAVLFREKIVKNFAKGTLNYRAPEIIKQEEMIDPTKADVFSLAIVLFCLVFGLFPFSEEQMTPKGSSNFYDVLQKEPSKFWFSHPACVNTRHKVSKEFRRLFEGMTKEIPENRLSLEEVMKSEWFNKEILNDLDYAIAMRSVLQGNK